MWDALQSRQRTPRVGTGMSSPATQADHSRENEALVCNPTECQ